MVSCLVRKLIDLCSSKKVYRTFRLILVFNHQTLCNFTKVPFSFRYLRAVAYRWLVRWFCGYLGWDNRRPLPACIYHHIRKKFSSGNSTGYSQTENKD